MYPRGWVVALRIFDSQVTDLSPIRHLNKLETLDIGRAVSWEKEAARSLIFDFLLDQIDVPVADLSPPLAAKYKTDYWNRPIRLLADQNMRYHACSDGPDKKSDTKDDICE